ncbi:RNA family related protein [Cyclospora cayetanensis]|uniref:RNA family related protein n=1 Tax=Cyclospora cayetanensis TaxID=88456 RepID=A0A1D3D6L9_9EIME|nr:RNA family related protein [Cyclospora cayetanensis]
MAGVGEAEVVACESDQTIIKLLERIDLYCCRTPSVNLCAVVGIHRIFLICAARTEKGFLSSSRLSAENIHEHFRLGEEDFRLGALCVQAPHFKRP